MKITLTKKELDDIKRAFDLLIEQENDQVRYTAYNKIIVARNRMFMDGF